MRLAGKPGFKETGVGWIPVDWSVEQVERLANVDTESLSNKTAADFSFRYISLGDVDAGKLIGGSTAITFAEAPSRARRIVRAGDTLFATVRPNLKGHLFVHHVDGNVIASTGFAVIRAREGIASPAFVYQSLLSANVDAQIERLTVGSNYPAVNSADVKGLLLPTPPLSEQQKIAAILAATDDKLDVISRQIGVVQTLKLSLLQTLFSNGIGSKSTDGRWTPHTAFVKFGSSEYPASWRMQRMGDFAPLVRREVDVQPGAIYPELGLRSFGKGTFHKPALTSEQVGSKRLFLIKAGDLLLSNVFAWEGAVAVVSPADDGRYGSHRYITCKVDPEIANVHFVARYLVTPAGLASIGIASPGGAGRNKTLGLAALADMNIPLPPLAEQNAINEVLECVEAKIAVLQAKHELYRDLKSGLMQKLLTGEWRVKVDADIAA